eukprot:1137180-Pelagomonas_calceolata.AAC.4
MPVTKPDHLSLKIGHPGHPHTQVFQEAAARSANPSEASPTVIPQAAAALSAITAAPEVPAPEVPQAEKPMSPAAEVSVPLGVAAAAEETGEATRAGPTGCLRDICVDGHSLWLASAVPLL